MDLSFVRELDPALKKSEGREGAARVVIHIVRRADPLFEQTGDGTLWADPVECLLDLQESRFEVQAQKFIASFPESNSLRSWVGERRSSRGSTSVTHVGTEEFERAQRVQAQ